MVKTHQSAHAFLEERAIPIHVGVGSLMLYTITGYLILDKNIFMGWALGKYVYLEF